VPQDNRLGGLRSAVRTAEDQPHAPLRMQEFAERLFDADPDLVAGEIGDVGLVRLPLLAREGFQHYPVGDRGLARVLRHAVTCIRNRFFKTTRQDMELVKSGAMQLSVPNRTNLRRDGAIGSRNGGISAKQRPQPVRGWGLFTSDVGRRNYSG